MKSLFIKHSGLLTITGHAKERARQRFGWSNESLCRMANKAFFQGLSHKQAKGRLLKYFDLLWSQYEKANNIRLHGEALFVFCGNVLLTVWQLPIELRKLGCVLQRKVA